VDVSISGDSDGSYPFHASSASHVIYSFYTVLMRNEYGTVVNAKRHNMASSYCTHIYCMVEYIAIFLASSSQKCVVSVVQLVSVIAWRVFRLSHRGMTSRGSSVCSGYPSNGNLYLLKIPILFRLIQFQDVNKTILIAIAPLDPVPFLPVSVYLWSSLVKNTKSGNRDVLMS